VGRRVSSRLEEKERRRKERLEQEQARARAAERRKRVQLAFGGVLTMGAVAAIAFVVLGMGGGAAGEDGEPTNAGDIPSNVKLPDQQISDMEDAAKAAGCTLANPPFEGANHAEKDFKPSDYKTNPPTSGDHTPAVYQDGTYAAGDTPNLGMTVHPLEHGRIEIQYKPGTPKATVAELEALLAENDDGYHMLLFQNATGMKAQVAATAWTHSLTCPAMNDKVFDAMRTFRSRYIDKGPERVP
jgi:hypothetical protein